MTEPTPSLQDVQARLNAMAPMAIARLRQIAATGKKASDRNAARRALKKYGLDSPDGR